jgi:hypothetical protein
MHIPFVGPSSTVRSSNADAQRSVNCYLEMDNNTPRAPVALLGTPGYSLITTLGAGPVRGSYALDNHAIIVSGATVYHVVFNGVSFTTTALGTMTTSTGPVGMAFDSRKVLIVDGVAGWLADLTTLTRITDVDFPNGVTFAAVLDSFFVVCGDGSGQFYINQTALDGSAWNGLDFATAEAAPDWLLSCVTDNRNLWLFGIDTTEIWEFTGNGSFPFERSVSAFMQIGTAAPFSCLAMDNTVYWLGRDSNGSGVVYKAQGYTPIRISTSAIEFAIQSYSTINDAIAFSYQQEGHSFYVLTFPTADKTWVYDASTMQWHERAYRNPGTGALTRWRPNCHVFLNNKNTVGDYANGNLYQLDLNVLTDNGDPIQRLRATQTQENEQKRLFFESLQVDMEVGTGSGTLSMRYSNDGGHTWSGYKTKALTAGSYGTRVKFGPTGAGRNRTWEISTIDPIKWAILGAEAQVTAGVS